MSSGFSIRKFEGHLRRIIDGNVDYNHDIIVSTNLIDIFEVWYLLDNPEKYNFYFWRTPNKCIDFTFEQILTSADFVQEVIDRCNPKWRPIYSVANKYNGGYSVDEFKNTINRIINDIRAKRLNQTETPIQQFARSYSNIHCALKIAISLGKDISKVETRLQSLAFKLLDEKLASTLPLMIDDILENKVTKVSKI